MKVLIKKANNSFEMTYPYNAKVQKITQSDFKAIKAILELR